tara:strand:- start:20056 stop:20940 length:885 start_codon:yes stop_codon:yes gene_type:complete
MENIGFIGIGTMGKGMVDNLLKNGFNVFAFNRTKAKAEAIKHENFNIVDNPKDLSEKADVIFTCVSNDDALKDVLFSENGVFQTINEKNILIDCGTTSAELTKEIYEKAKEKNVEFLDVPITGSKLGAEGGQILFMGGGNKEIFDKCEGLWNAMGKKAIYCGTTGFGQKAKYALNLTQSLILESYLEGLIFGLKNGVPIDAMKDVLENSGANNGVGTFKVPYIMKRDFNPHFLFKLMHKDLKIAEKEMQKLNLELPLTKEIFKQFQKGHEKGLDEEDFSSIVKLLEEDADVKIE